MSGPKSVERRRIMRTMKGSQDALHRLDERIGRLMGQRVDREEHIAECIDALRRLDGDQP